MSDAWSEHRSQFTDELEFKNLPADSYPMSADRLRFCYCLACTADIKVNRSRAPFLLRPRSCPVCGSSEILSELPPESQATSHVRANLPGYL